MASMWAWDGSHASCRIISRGVKEKNEQGNDQIEMVAESVVDVAGGGCAVDALTCRWMYFVA